MVDKMFRTLKVGDKIYVVKDGKDLVFHECTISSTMPESANVNDTMNGVFSPITIIAKSDTEEFKLSHINSMLDYLEINGADETKVISSDKSKINDYVKRIHDDAKYQLSKMDVYKNKITQGDAIILSISANPKDTSDIRFNNLEKSVSGLTSNMDKILELLQSKTEEKEEVK